MLRSPHALLLASATFLLPLVTPASAAPRGWRAARAEYDEARARLERAAPGEIEATAEAARALGDASALLLRADPAHGVTHLITAGLASPSWRVGELATTALARAQDEEALRALVRALEEAPEALRPRVAQLLGGVRGERVVAALIRALRARHEPLRIAAARALARHGQAAASAASALRRLLDDDSRAARWAAADALEGATGARPEGFPPPAFDARTGLPDHLGHLDRVVFLLDGSEAASVEAFEDPLAPPPADDAAAAQPRTSALALAGRLVGEALRGLGAETRFALARFAGRSRWFTSDYAAAGRRDEARVWLAQRPSGRDGRRDLAGALDAALALTPLPQVVFLVLAGPPTTARGEPFAETIEAARASLWRRGVVLHVLQLALAPPPARSERARVAAAQAAHALDTLAAELALAGGGRVTRLALARPSPPPVEEPPPPADPLPADLDLGAPLSRRDARRVERTLRDALREGGPGAAALVERVAACPDARHAAPLVVELLAGEPALADAAAAGFARNGDPAVVAALLDALADARDPTHQLALLRAVGAAPGAAAARGLVKALADLAPDPARVAWRALAARPPAELAPLLTLPRLARGARGLAALAAGQAVAKATGAPAPSTEGLEVGSAALLPERFVASGVAFVLDTDREMAAPFQRPATVPPEPPLPPVSRLDAAQRELRRALAAAARDEVRVNVLTTANRSWARAATLPEAGGDDAATFVARQRPSGARDVGWALERALADPAIEEIYLLVSGPPARGLGDRDPAILAARVRSLQRQRAVPIQVVGVLGAAASDDPLEEAARRDLERALAEAYGDVAAAHGGSLEIRARLATLE